MTYLTAIYIFPIKSLDGVNLDECQVLPGGALAADRGIALVDRDGNFINGKRQAAVHRLRAGFDLGQRTVRLSSDTLPPALFHLDDQEAVMCSWLSDFFGVAVRLRRDPVRGFPDDPNAPGPTVTSTATLQTVANWFPGQTAGEMRLRFRMNLELGGDDPFWEDRLFGEPGVVTRFRIGDVEFWGTNPCERCVVPTRSPTTGEVVPGFARLFADRRQQSLPSWSAASRFDHYYRLGVNTRLAELHGGRLRVGDEVRVIG
jgi:uncharacterized protein YcbX